MKVESDQTPHISGTFEWKLQGYLVWGDRQDLISFSEYFPWLQTKHYTYSKYERSHFSKPSPKACTHWFSSAQIMLDIIILHS